MTGDIDQLMRAVALVVTKLSENPDYHLLTDANLTYSHRLFGGAGGGSGGGPAGMQQHHHHHAAAAAAAAPGPAAGGTTVTMAVPEDKVGVVIGKQGQVRPGEGGEGRGLKGREWPISLLPRMKCEASSRQQLPGGRLMFDKGDGGEGHLLVGSAPVDPLWAP